MSILLLLYFIFYVLIRVSAFSDCSIRVFQFFTKLCKGALILSLHVCCPRWQGYVCSRCYKLDLPCMFAIYIDTPFFAWDRCSINDPVVQWYSNPKLCIVGIVKHACTSQCPICIFIPVLALRVDQT